METIKLYLENYDREKLFEKFNREYVVELYGTSTAQNTGRFNVPKKCLDLLKLNFGDSVYVVKSTDGSTLLTNNVAKKDLNNVVYTLKFGRGKQRLENVLRINQRLAKYLGHEQLGFVPVAYNKTIALKISPVSLILTIS